MTLDTFTLFLLCSNKIQDGNITAVCRVPTVLLYLTCGHGGGELVEAAEFLLAAADLPVRQLELLRTSLLPLYIPHI